MGKLAYFFFLGGGGERDSLGGKGLFWDKGVGEGLILEVGLT